MGRVSVDGMRTDWENERPGTGTRVENCFPGLEKGTGAQSGLQHCAQRDGRREPGRKAGQTPRTDGFTLSIGDSWGLLQNYQKSGPRQRVWRRRGACGVRPEPPGAPPPCRGSRSLYTFWGGSKVGIRK